MAGEIPKPGETLQSIEPPQQSQMEKPEVSTEALTSEELQEANRKDELKILQEKRKNTEARANSLQQVSQSKRDKEGWVNQPANKYTLSEGGARSSIRENVEKSMVEKYVPELTKAGFDQANIDIINGTISDIVFDYCSRTFTDADLMGTKFSKENEAKIASTLNEFSEKTLAPKLLMVIKEIQRIYESKKTLFPSAMTCWRGFSEFTGLNFINNGVLDAPKLKEAFLLDNPTLDFQLKSFDQYLNINGEIATLAGQETNLLLVATTPKSPTEKTTEKFYTDPSKENMSIEKPITPETATDNTPKETTEGIATLFEKGTLKLKNKERFLIPADYTDETDKENLNKLNALLPESLSGENKDKASLYLREELRKLNPAAGETFELAENGKWQKVDVKTEQEAIAAARQKAGKETEIKKGDAWLQEVIKGTLGIFEGDNVLGKIITFILTLFGMKGLGSLGENQEFTGLDMTERPLAEAMKKTMEELKLNAKTIHALLINPEATKKILKQASDEATATNTPLDWSKYFEKHLNTDDLSELKQEKEIKVEKIAKMILTPNDEPNQPSAPASAVAMNPQPSEPSAPEAQPTTPEAPPETPAAAA